MHGPYYRIRGKQKRHQNLKESPDYLLNRAHAWKNRKLKTDTTRKRTAETEIPKQLSQHSAMMCDTNLS